jgi:hypothetical protein
VYYTPYKILLTVINVASCYYSLYKYARYFAKRYIQHQTQRGIYIYVPFEADNPHTRHPKIIEDEKAIEVVLRLEETTHATPGTDNNGRRFTVTAIGSRLSVDRRRSTIRSTSIAAGDSLAIPSAVERGAGIDSRRSSKASSNMAAEDDLEIVVSARTVRDTLYQPHLDAIEETQLRPRAASSSSRSSGVGP